MRHGGQFSYHNSEAVTAAVKAESRSPTRLNSSNCAQVPGRFRTSGAGSDSRVPGSFRGRFRTTGFVPAGRFQNGSGQVSRL